jgi:hypothetical protein
MNFNLKIAPVAHKFHAKSAPHPLVVCSAKASCNGAMLIPHMDVLGYDQKVWGVNTVHGPKEVKDGDWIVEHKTFGVLAMSDSEFHAIFTHGDGQSNGN